MKKCKDCNQIKSLELFHKNSQSLDGISFYCKKCKRIRDSASHKKHKGKRAECSIQYRAKNKEAIRERKKEDYIKNKDRHSKKSKEWYEINKERVSSENKIKYQLNKNKINAKIKKKKQENPIFRLQANLRSRLSIALKNNQKKGSAVRDLGCSIQFLKNHLESMFQPGMNWDNYGFGEYKWNVDHIIPLTMVDLTNREQLLKVCHYTNLQPLWHLDNIKKGNKII